MVAVAGRLDEVCKFCITNVLAGPRRNFSKGSKSDIGGDGVESAGYAPSKIHSLYYGLKVEGGGIFAQDSFVEVVQIDVRSDA